MVAEVKFNESDLVALMEELERTPPKTGKIVETPASKNGLNYYVDPDHFKKSIELTDANLDEAMKQQASLRSHYSFQAAQAAAQYARLKARFEVQEAALYAKHKKAILDRGEKTTEAQIDAAVKQDPEWLAAKDHLIEAEALAEINRGLVFALGDRKDMLIQLGSDRRSEAQGQVRILENENRTDKANSIAERIAMIPKA